MEEALGVAARLVAEGREAFIHDELLQYAADTAISRLAECARKLPEDVTAAIPSVPWPALMGMRNRLQHASLDTDYALVWNVLASELPRVSDALRTYRNSTDR
ncbi:MAG: HepT-like ribonuclease domain-containing protein [Acidimicrobiia bacterium]|nr:HepT-like ribonuclease domain-containing protein [Acidimicrobiia bacterium]